MQLYCFPCATFQHVSAICRVLASDLKSTAKWHTLLPLLTHSSSLQRLCICCGLPCCLLHHSCTAEGLCICSDTTGMLPTAPATARAMRQDAAHATSDAARLMSATTDRLTAPRCAAAACSARRLRNVGHTLLWPAQGGNPACCLQRQSGTGKGQISSMLHH